MKSRVCVFVFSNVSISFCMTCVVNLQGACLKKTINERRYRQVKYWKYYILYMLVINIIFVCFRNYNYHKLKNKWSMWYTSINRIFFKCTTGSKNAFYLQKLKKNFFFFLWIQSTNSSTRQQQTNTNRFVVNKCFLNTRGEQKKIFLGTRSISRILTDKKGF